MSRRSIRGNWQANWRIRKCWPWILLGLVALALGLDLAAWVWAEGQWFQELGYDSVLQLRLRTQGLLLLLGMGVTGLFLGFNLWLSDLWRYPPSEDPDFVPDQSDQLLGAMGLRLLLLMVGGLGLLLVLVLTHHGLIFVENWQPNRLLREDPGPPSQFQLQAIGRLLGAAWAMPWRGAIAGGLVLLTLLFPWPLLILGSGAMTIGFGLVFSNQWMRVLPLFAPTSFAHLDPQFNQDVSFYIFTLPVLELLRFWGVGLLLFALIAVSLLYLLSGNSLSHGKFPGFSPTQQRHIYALGGGLMLAVSLSHWLARYEVLYSKRGANFGASYTDVVVQLPVDMALSFVAGSIALWLLLGAEGWLLQVRKPTRFDRSGRAISSAWPRVQAPRQRFNPLQFFILHPFLDLWISYLAIVVIVGNGIPAIVQQLVVLPSEFNKERIFIERSILETRRAFDLDHVEIQTFDPLGNLDRQAITDNQATLDNIRLWDSRPLLLANRQLQQIRPYYSFPDADIDRYRLKPQVNGPIGAKTESNLALRPTPIKPAAVKPVPKQTPGPPDYNAENQQVIIAARELDANGLPKDAQTWFNQHLVYTHGYGFTLSPVNSTDPSGLPAYFIKNIGKENSQDRSGTTILGSPSLGITPENLRKRIPINNPRIYYGTLNSRYIMAPSRARELDYASGSENIYSTYDGQAGISISGWRRLLFGIHLRDWQMVITRDFTPATKVLFRRNIQNRVKAIAPFLRYDSDPYLVSANADLRLENGTLVDPIAPDRQGKRNYLYWIIDAYTTSDRYPYSDPGDHPYNYLRNSVKVVVDAYNGSVDFYIADNQDPIIKTWSRLFSGLFKPLDAMPPDLRAHTRYPVDLFASQSERFLTYHMTDPLIFYNREDQWQVPMELYGTESRPVEPYYLIMRLPTAESEEFVLLHPFTPVGRNNLIAWLAARSDGDNYGKLLIYQFPKQRLVYGPEQIEARINQDPEISRQIALWNRQGSSAIQGNLLVIPIGQSLLYVEPLYLEADRNSLPTLVRVIVAYNDKIVMTKTLTEAIDQLFPAAVAKAG
jgi:uncharacterized protein